MRKKSRSYYEENNCIFAAIFALVLFCGCVATVGWYKQGVSNYEVENALAQCEYEAGKDHVERGDFVSNCMKRQGFRYGTHGGGF